MRAFLSGRCLWGLRKTRQKPEVASDWGRRSYICSGGERAAGATTMS